MWNTSQFNPEKHSLLDWVRLQGGIKPSNVTRDSEEIRHVCSRAQAGYNLINTKRGQTLDLLTSDAIACGFLSYNASHNEFLDMLGRDIQAKVEGKLWCRVFHPSKSWDDEYITFIEIETTEDLDFLVECSCSSCGNPEASTLYLSDGWQDTICDDCMDMLAGVCRGN